MEPLITPQPDGQSRVAYTPFEEGTAGVELLQLVKPLVAYLPVI